MAAVETVIEQIAERAGWAKGGKDETWLRKTVTDLCEREVQRGAQGGYTEGWNAGYDKGRDPRQER